MRISTLLLFSLFTASSAAFVGAQTSKERPNYFGTAAPSTTAQPPADAKADKGSQKESQTFEQQITGSMWEFPWESKMKWVELQPDGKLVLGWNKSAKGFKWRVPSEGVVEVYVYMDGKNFDIMRVPSNGRTAALTRGGKQIAIIKRKA